jgi:hypothetical protein
MVINPKKPTITPHLGLFWFLVNVNTGLNQCRASKSFTLIYLLSVWVFRVCSWKNIRDGGGSLILKFFIIPEPKVMTKSKDCPTMVDAKLDYLAYPAGKYLILPFSQKCN